MLRAHAQQGQFGVVFALEPFQEVEVPELVPFLFDRYLDRPAVDREVFLSFAVRVEELYPIVLPDILEEATVRGGKEPQVPLFVQLLQGGGTDRKGYSVQMAGNHHYAPILDQSPHFSQALLVVQKFLTVHA